MFQSLSTLNTIDALQAGKSVLIEEPLTLVLQSAEAILKAEKNVITMPGLGWV